MTAPLRLGFDVAPAYALVDSLRLQRVGRSDPTVALELAPDVERFAKCASTPEGALTLAAWRAGPERIEVALYGPGAEWAAARARRFLGLDDACDVVVSHPRLMPLRAALRAMHLVHALSLSQLHAAVILQQRVTFESAARAWRDMCARVARPAPGPLPLWMPPEARDWAGLGQPEARALDIDVKRWKALRAAAEVAGELDRCGDHATPLGQLAALTERLRGTGPWTTGLLAGLGLGDADAVVVGDLHLPGEVSAFLTGHPIADDARMLELLEPFRPHRFRIVRAMIASGRRRL